MVFDAVTFLATVRIERDPLPTYDGKPNAAKRLS